MSYPTLEQYNEALQFPKQAFLDTELKAGSVATTGLGIPLALCGGFALTYTVSAGRSRYAVRCFHKQSNALEYRYNAISSRIKSLHSPYFLDFEFKQQGVRVNGHPYPIVKMAWASGETLGEFLDKRHSSRTEVQRLSSALRTLATYLGTQGIAHGDIQPGNVMVSNGGQTLQLIDYDGMFVQELMQLGSAELGHRNFQHPKRTSQNWDERLDNFSFISLHVALLALECQPSLWDRFQSDGDSFLFKANDFVEPAQSAIFVELFNHPQVAVQAKALASICKAPYDKTPTLDDFIAGRNIPQVVVTPSLSPRPIAAQYMSPFAVLDAQRYEQCFGHVGDRVELIGKIVEVKQDYTKYKKPYVFVNFGDWKGNIVKITIWSEGLSKLQQRPDCSWVGKWVSVVGLMEPPYHSAKYKYSHLSVTISSANQLHIISDTEARYRLSGSGPSKTSSYSSTANKEILNDLRGKSAPSVATVPPRQSGLTPNQVLLQNMRSSSSTVSARPHTTSGPSPQPQASSKTGKGCLSIILVGISLFVLVLCLTF